MRGLEIDDQFELAWLLDGQLAAGVPLMILST
jgi:hypothetical protein